MSVSIEIKEKNLTILFPDNEKIELILCNAGTFKMDGEQRYLGTRIALVHC